MNIENRRPYIQWGLPQGAKARLGKGGIKRLQYSPDGTQLAAIGSIGIWLYDAHSYTEVAFMGFGQVPGTNPLPPSWAGTTLVTLNRDQTISLWDTHKGQRQITFVDNVDNVEGICDVVLSPDGTTFVTAGYDKSIRFWDRRTGRLRFTVVGHTDTINALAFSLDGKILASGGDDQTIRLWDTQNGRHLSTLTGPEAEIWMLAFSPNGIILASRNMNETIDLQGYLVLRIFRFSI